MHVRSAMAIEVTNEHAMRDSKRISKLRMRTHDRLTSKELQTFLFLPRLIDLRMVKSGFNFFMRCIEQMV